MPTDTPHPILFIPGPVEVEPELRATMAMPLVGHRSQGFKAEVRALLPKLQRLFRTKAHALFENVPATGLMEAAVRNLVRERVLHLTNGAFSERWAQISTACGRRPDTLAVEWGAVVTPKMLREKLAGEAYEAVTITHSETSTGALSPLRELAAVVREVQPEALILVDAVTSLAAAEIQFDAWGLDCAFAGTQKALALPPGLTVYALSERAMARAKTIPGRGYLLDFPRAAEGLAKDETLATPCVPLVFALSQQLDRIEKETLEGRWRRHQELQRATIQWCQQHDFSLFVADGNRSPSVTTVNASGRKVTDLIARGKAKGFTLSNGYGKLKDLTFRIGHMGDHQLDRLQAFLGALAS